MPAYHWIVSGTSGRGIRVFRMNRNPKLRISLAHCSWTFLGIVVSLLFTATVARSGEAAGHRRLAVAYPAVTGSFAPFFIARELGLYTKHGLDIELVLAAGSGKVTLLLIGGSSPIVIGSSSDIALRYILKQQGLIPGKDLRILATGGHRETLAAIKQELVAGGMITVLFKPIARAEGYREHIDLSTSGLELQTSALVTTRRFAEAESEVVRRFLSSFIEAVHAYKTRKNEAKGIIAKYARVTDSEALEQNYVYYFGIFKELPVPTLAGLKVEQEMIAETDSKARDYDLRRAIDPTFLQQIEASGFIRKLYGGER